MVVFIFIITRQAQGEQKMAQGAHITQGDIQLTLVSIASTSVKHPLHPLHPSLLANMSGQPCPLITPSRIFMCYLMCHIRGMLDMAQWTAPALCLGTSES